MPAGFEQSAPVGTSDVSLGLIGLRKSEVRRGRCLEAGSFECGDVRQNAEFAARRFRDEAAVRLKTIGCTRSLSADRTRRPLLFGRRQRREKIFGDERRRF
jgi:hypothetical protein